MASILVAAYEAYRDNEKLSPLVRVLTWTNNLLILMAAQTDEKREFYLIHAAKYRYSKRELGRQIDSILYECHDDVYYTNKQILIHIAIYT